MIDIKLLVLVCLVGVVSCGKDHFFQYANVPGWNAYEFGYNRGNDKHFTSRFEKAHGWTFKTKVRWGDKNGWGESYWDYNHGDKKKGHEKKGWGHGHGHHGGGGGGGGGGGQGSFSENVETRLSPQGSEIMQEPSAPRYDNMQQAPPMQTRRRRPAPALNLQDVRNAPVQPRRPNYNQREY